MKKDIAELKKRITKDDVSFSKLSACYVDANKNIVTSFTKTFLSLDDEEMFKYMEIAKKVLSGKYGNALLKLPITNDRNKQSLQALVSSELKDKNITDVFYDQIINHFEFSENYIIILFHDIYDVLTKTKDNGSLDLSEESYEYILCAICPVELSTPGLSYYANNNEIATRTRDWVVGVPETGFIYPNFEERSADRDSLLLYNKKPKNPHMELAQMVFGCENKMTSVQKKEKFDQIIQDSLGDFSENVQSYKTLFEHLNEEIEREEERQQTTVISEDSIEFLFRNSDLTESDIDLIKDEFSNTFNHDSVELGEITNKKEIEKDLQMVSALSILSEVKEELKRLNGNEFLINQIDTILDED